MASSLQDRPLRWRSRPLLLAAGCTASGIVAAQRIDLGQSFWLAVIGLALACVVLARALPRRRIVSLRPLALTVATGVALLALGGQRHALWSAQQFTELSMIAAEADEYEHAIPLMVTGRVISAPTQTERRKQFTMLVDSVGFDDLQSAPGRANVTLWQPRFDSVHTEWPTLHPGHSITVSGTLRPLPERRNPADFDYGAYLQRQGIHAVLSASDSGAVVITGYDARSIDRLLTTSRLHIRKALGTYIASPESRAVLEALLLADRSNIDHEIRQSFSRTGLAHLLAVSGLHVFLVGMVLYGLLKPLLHRLGWSWKTVEWTRALLTMVLLGGYVAIVGGPASATRALVMAGALIGGKALERPSNSLNSLGAAALVLLLARPAALFDVGFQLSFAAVGAIIILMPVLELPLPGHWRQWGIGRPVISLVLVSVAATLGTMPVLLAHFGVFPIAGIALNLIAIPLTAATLGSGLLTVLLDRWLPSLASMAGSTANLSAEMLLGTGTAGVHYFGWTAIDAHVTSAAGLAVLVLSVVCVALFPRPRHRWRTLSALGVCAAILLWMPLANGDSRPVMDLLFFDVGQGDAVLVGLPAGGHMLIDAGPIDPYGDAGRRTILPHLDRFGIRSLDAVVVSHPHADHLGGVPSLLENDRIAILYDNGESYHSDLYFETFVSAVNSSIPMRRLQAGDELRLDPHVRIHALHPGPEPDAHANDASVVLRLTFGAISVLFAGDVEYDAEATLTGRFGESLCADVIKVPHHGSRTSSTEPLVDAVSACGGPLYSVIQVAHRNRYQLPNDEVIKRWQGTGAEVLTTAAEGAVWLRTDGSRIWRVRWR